MPTLKHISMVVACELTASEAGAIFTHVQKILLGSKCWLMDYLACQPCMIEMDITTNVEQVRAMTTRKIYNSRS